MAHETAKSLRLRFRLSQTAAAAKCGLAPNTYRVGELTNGAGLSDDSRQKYDAFVAQLRDRAASEAA